MLSLPAGLSEFDGLLEHPRPDFAPGKGPYGEMQQQSAVLCLCTHWLCSPKRRIRKNMVKNKYRVHNMKLGKSGVVIRQKEFQWDTRFFEIGLNKLTFPRKIRTCRWEMVYLQEDLGLNGFLFVQVFTSNLNSELKFKYLEGFFSWYEYSDLHRCEEWKVSPNLEELFLVTVLTCNHIIA